MPDEVDFNEFYDVLLDTTRKAFRFAQESHPEETFYAFGLNYHPTWIIIPAANTEDAHMRDWALTPEHRINKTLEWFHGRWEPMNWVYYRQDHFDPVNTWLNQHRVPLPVTGHDESRVRWALFDIGCETCCMAVLKTLDQEGMFGEGTARETVIIHLMSPLRREDYMERVYQLNSRMAYERWRVEWELYQHAQRVFFLRHMQRRMN